jgi:hypothetical protein
VEGADFFSVSRPKSVYLAGSFLICATLSFRRYHTFEVYAADKKMCACQYMKKSIFQILNVCVGILGFGTIMFCAYCFGKLNTFNPFIYTLLIVGVILTAISVNVCTNDFHSKWLIKLYLVVLCTTLAVETALVITYLDMDTQSWLLNQIPSNIQNLLQQNIHLIGVIFLGVAVGIMFMFALGVEIIYFKRRHRDTGRRVPGPDTYLLAESDINNLIGAGNDRGYKRVDTRDQGCQYQLEEGGYLCTKCYRIECECPRSEVIVAALESDTGGDDTLETPEPNSAMLCLKCHDLECKCGTQQAALCSLCFESPCKC